VSRDKEQLKIGLFLPDQWRQALLRREEGLVVVTVLLPDRRGPDEIADGSKGSKGRVLPVLLGPYSPRKGVIEKGYVLTPPDNEGGVGLGAELSLNLDPSSLPGSLSQEGAIFPQSPGYRHPGRPATLIEVFSLPRYLEEVGGKRLVLPGPDAES